MASTGGTGQGDALGFTRPLPFTKGHGTENDFMLVLDVDGQLHLDAAVVAALCDRRSGIGGDGLIRVVRTSAVPDGVAGTSRDAVAEGSDPEWFMDYRNADGSLAEMCGNGVRVFVAFLQAHGLVDGERLDSASGLPVATRAGVRHVRRSLGPSGEDDWLAVDMGPWRLPGGSTAARQGHDALVQVQGLDGVQRPGLSVDVGNPHTVVALATEEELEAADLFVAPGVDPVPVDGTNVELVVVAPSLEAAPFLESGDGAGRLRMRVHERGVGETRSCGTGACAAALAATTWGGPDAPGAWLVDVPGGQVSVRLLADQRVELAGPAVLVATGTVDLDRLRP
ncbi:MAG: diaminopimelate epimerase [Actinomycetes bacterium]